MSEHAESLYELYAEVVDKLTKQELVWHRGAKNSIDSWIDNDRFDLYNLIGQLCLPDDYDGCYTPEQEANAIYVSIKLSEALGWETKTD